MKVLITGNGQDSNYLAKFLLREKNYEVIIGSRRSGSSNNWRAKELNIDKEINYVTLDITEYENVKNVLNQYRPDEIYNLAAQSFVADSFSIPFVTTQVNYIGVLNLLEAVKNIPDYNPKFYQASTSEMFGKVKEIPQTETTPFNPKSPYGISKLAAHFLVVNYRESYNMFACSGILFNHESPLRGEEFVTRKITKGVAEIYYDKRKFIELGNLDSMRDWGHAEDYVKAMWLMLQQEQAEDYIISTGVSYTIQQFVDYAFETIGMKIHWVGEGINKIGLDDNNNVRVKVNPLFYRPSDVDFLLGKSEKALKKLNWSPKIDIISLITEMVEKDLERIKLS